MRVLMLDANRRMGAVEISPKRIHGKVSVWQKARVGLIVVATWEDTPARLYIRTIIGNHNLTNCFSNLSKVK